MSLSLTTTSTPPSSLLLGTRILACFVCLLCLLLGAHESPAQQVLAGHVTPAVLSRSAPLLNALPADKQLHLSLVLPLANKADLNALLARLYDPTSPDYRHFLSVDQFTQRFAPSPGDYAAVVAFAKTNGLTVTGSHANRLVVPVTGSVENINRAFAVRLNTYQHPTESRLFSALTANPLFPLGSSSRTSPG